MAPINEGNADIAQLRPWLRNRSHARLILAVIAIAITLAASFSHDALRQSDSYIRILRELSPEARYATQLARWAILVMLGLLIVVRPRRIASELGINPGIRAALRGISFTLVCSLPMALAPFATGGDLRADVALWSVVSGALLAPLAEELLYRGYAFGQLWRRAGLGLWASAILTGVLFGLLHLGPGTRGMSAGQVVLHIAIIAAGGVAYAWLLAMWRFNLWVPIGLHLFMNLWWTILAMGESPVSSTLTIVSRILVVSIAITWTILMHRGVVKDWR